MADKVLCPWCGAEMYPTASAKVPQIEWCACYICPDCPCVNSPEVEGFLTPEDALEAAKAAALHRYTPPKSIEEDDANKAQMPEWISVKDKLPENDSHYLVFRTDTETDTCEVVECTYYGDGEWMTADLEVIIDGVTHWMPMPDKPTDEEKERGGMGELRPMTLEEVRKEILAWLETKDWKPQKVEMIKRTGGVVFRPAGSKELHGVLYDTYNKDWRCWSRKPTDEERSAAEWGK